MSAPVPEWLDGVQRRAENEPQVWHNRLTTPVGAGRESAVLMLFGPGSGAGEDLVLIERSHRMRSHAGQIAFPGGGREAQDADLVQTALREAAEEIDLKPAGVRVLGALPTVHIPVSSYDVTPVLAWWEDPTPVRVHDPGEVEQVLSVPVDALLDPRHRFRVRYRGRSWIGPAFDIDGLLLWGFTAALVDGILDLAGLTQPWDTEVIRDLS